MTENCKIWQVVAIPQKFCRQSTQQNAAPPNPAWLTMLFRASTPARRRNCRASTNSATLFPNYPSIHPEIVHACMYFGTFLDWCIHHHRYVLHILHIIYTYGLITYTYKTFQGGSKYVHYCIHMFFSSASLPSWKLAGWIHASYDLALKQHQPVGCMYGISTYFMQLIFMANVGNYTIHDSYGQNRAQIGDTRRTDSFRGPKL